MAKFEIGEIAIIKSKNRPYLNGVETKILARFVWPKNGKTAYICSVQTNPNGWYEEALRKKKPPQELSSWEAIQKLTEWNPSKVRA